MTEQLELSPRLSRDQRAALGAIADVLLPGTERLPSGRSVGVHEKLLDRVVLADPTLYVPLRDVADRAGDRFPESVAALQALAGDDTERVLFAFHAAYYMSREVMAALDYPGQGGRPVNKAVPEEQVSEDLLAPVRERGPIYIPAPDSHEGSDS